MNATPKQLRNAITQMDGMAQDAFSEIATIAKLALRALEAPETCLDLDGLAVVLSSIRAKALDCENTINCEAEDVGCHYQDPARLRRQDARRKAEETAANRGACAMGNIGQTTTGGAA